MIKLEILKKYENQEDKMLISRLFDKIEEVKENNQMAYTDFLDMHEQAIVTRELKTLKVPYILWGGFTEASRQMCIFYPEFMSEEEAQEKCNEDIQIVRINLPPSLKGTYEHRMYLSAIMKIGIKRKKAGDIVCDKNGADVVVSRDLAPYVEQKLSVLTKFSKCKFEILPITKIRELIIKKREIEILVQSLRIDGIIAELLHISRSQAEDYLKAKKVFINYENEFKCSKLLKEKDVLVIRGKGKFEFDEIVGNTKKNKFVLRFFKYE